MDRFEKLKKAQELELCTSKQVWEELGDSELDFYTLDSWADAKIALAAAEEEHMNSLMSRASARRAGREETKLIR